MKIGVKQIFFFALVLRILLAPFFYHPDIKTQAFHFQFFSQGQLNIYQYLADNKSKLPYTDTFNYLPLTYLGLGFIQTILSPFMPSDFHLWLNDWSATQNHYPNLFYYLLILKIPYIIFDLATAYLLFRLYGKSVLKLWLFNPFTFYFIYILNNFDIIPVFFSVLSLYYLRQQRDYLSYFALGFAVSLKLYPLIFFPFFLFYRRLGIKKIVLCTLCLLLPLFISIMPFIFTPAFLHSFSGSGLTQKIIEVKLWHIPLYPLLYLGILIYYLSKKEKSIEFSCLLLFLAFTVLVNFHPQWLLWFLPFLLPLIIKRKLNLLIYSLFFTLALTYTFLINDLYLFWGHLIPINLSFLQLSSPYLLVQQKILLSPELIQTYLKYLLALISLPLILLSKPHEK